MYTSDVAIILQGRVSVNTEEIIKYYQNFGCKMILSTYTNTVNFDTTKYPLLDVVMMDPPRELGVGNRNIQRWSTYNGINRAKELGFKYSLKSRTDHFFKNPNTINILKMNIETFPIFNSNGQIERIIVPNGGTTLNQSWGGPFHISDHWLFGTTEDLYNYFDINNPHWDRNNRQNLPGVATEVEFCRLWMKKMNINYTSFSEFLKDRFIVLDNTDLFYDQLKEKVSNIMLVKTDWNKWCDPLTIHSRHWFNFYNGNIYTVEQEKLLNQHQKFVI